jgi:putative transposase
MTGHSMALLELAEEHADGGFMKELGQFVLQRLMELEVEGRCGATRHERSDARTNQRNGYRERALETRVGTLEPRKASGQALVAVVQEAYLRGVSTRNRNKKTAFRRPKYTRSY